MSHLSHGKCVSLWRNRICGLFLLKLWLCSVCYQSSKTFEPILPKWATVSSFLLSYLLYVTLLFQVCIKTSCSFLFFAHKLFYMWHKWSFRHLLKMRCLLTYFYTHIFRQIMKVLQANLSYIIRSWELCNILSYYALNSKKTPSLEVIWHIKCMQSSVCLPHVLLFPVMLICPFIISSHHILLTVLLSPPPPYTFTDLSLLLREFHSTLGSSMCNRNNWL